MKYFSKISGFFLVICSNLAFAQVKDMSYLKEGVVIPAPSLNLQSDGYFDDLEKALLNPDAVLHLNLKKKNLNEFPTAVYSFKNLEILDLSGNEIVVIPEGINKAVPKLRELYLNSNNLKSIGYEIVSLTHLEVLHILNNPIEFIVPEIRNMGSLNTLKLSSTNSGIKFQAAIWDMSNLNYLFLMKMNIEFIPSSIVKFTGLKELCLNDNLISQIPSELYQLKQIEYLGLGNNKISDFQKELGQLGNLNYLAVFGNPISSFPETVSGLKKLDWFAGWNTKMDEAAINKLKAILPPQTRSNFDGKGIH